MKRLSIILTIVALILWSYSICKARLVIDDAGLLHSFPSAYFVAIALVTIASFILWRSRERHNGLLFLQLFLVIASLLLVPILIGGQHRGSSVWISKEVSYILDQGHLNTEVCWYHQYPVSWLFSAELIKVLGVKDLTFFNKLAPFFWQLVYFPVIYVFLKNTIGRDKSHYIWCGIWLFYLAEWLGFSGLSPQTFGWFFFLLLLALLSISWRQRLESASHQTSMILTSAGLILSHWLSSVFAFAGVALLLLRKKIKLSMVILLATGIAVWTIYGASIFFHNNIGDFLNHAFRIDEVWKLGLVSRIASPNPSHDLLDKVRSWYTLAFLGMGVLGFFLGLANKKNKGEDRTIFLVAIGVIIAALTVAFSYRHEIIDKTYLFCIPLIAYFGVKLLKHRITAALMCLVILVLPPAYMFGHYGNALSDYTSPSNIQGMQFFNDKGATYGSLTGNYNNWGYLSYTEWLRTYYDYPPEGFILTDSFIDHPDQYEGILYEKLEFKDTALISGNESGDYPHYITVSRHDKAYYYWVWNRLTVIDEVEASLNNSVNCDLVYTNRDMQLYVAENGP